MSPGTAVILPPGSTVATPDNTQSGRRNREDTLIDARCDRHHRLHVGGPVNRRRRPGFYQCTCGYTGRIKSLHARPARTAGAAPAAGCPSPRAAAPSAVASCASPWTSLWRGATFCARSPLASRPDARQFRRLASGDHRSRLCRSAFATPVTIGLATTNRMERTGPGRAGTVPDDEMSCAGALAHREHAA